MQHGQSAQLTPPRLPDAERHRTLLEISNALLSNLSREALFRAIAAALRRVVRFERSSMEAMLRRVLQGEVLTTPDIRIEMPTGRTVWESNRYSPHRDAQGNINGVIALVGDVTQTAPSRPGWWRASCSAT